LINLRLTRALDKYLGIFLCYFLIYLNKLIALGAHRAENGQVKKILMIKFVGIGNLVMILPTIKAIRKRYPDARIDMFTLVQNKEVLQNNSFINNTYFITNRNLYSFVFEYVAHAIRLRREKYDLILDFEQFAKTSTVFGLMIGGRERIGFDTPGQGRGIGYTKKVAYLDYKHMVETFFRIAKGAGVEKADLSPLKLNITDEERKRTEQFLKDNHVEKDDIFIGIHMGSGINMMTQRRWENDKFARLADQLIDKYRIKIIFTGAGDDEAELVGHTLTMMKNSVINAANKLTLKELAVLIEKSCFFISNDTAPIHIASAMGTPVVGFYGPNTPYLYGPRGGNDLVFYRDLFCSPCITNYNSKISRCEHPICMEGISVEAVFEGIEKKYFLTNTCEYRRQHAVSV